MCLGAIMAEMQHVGKTATACGEADEELQKADAAAVHLSKTDRCITKTVLLITVMNAATCESL